MALEKGYNITNIHSAISYTRYTGLMREYAGNFVKLNIENSGAKHKQNVTKSISIIND